MLDVVVNSSHYDLQLDPLGNYVSVTFRALTDGHGGTQINTIQVISNGETLIVPFGQTWFNTEIQGGGTLIVSGTAIGTTDSGGTQDVFGSTVSAVISAGTELVESGGVTTSTTISTGVFQHVSSGGVASNTTVMAGAIQEVLSGATASNTHISGGVVDASGRIAGMLIDNGGQVVLRPTASATGVVVSNGFEFLFGGTPPAVVAADVQQTQRRR